MNTSENPYAGQGAVLLDIGGDVGALVVTMPVELDGVEVEIRPAGGAVDPQDHHDHDHHHDHHGLDHGCDRDAGHRPHVAVVARPLGTGVIHSLVFPELTTGRYELYRRPVGPIELTVAVRGGEVTHASWPEA